MTLLGIGRTSLAKGNRPVTGCGMMGGVEYITGAAGVMYLLFAAILAAIVVKAFLPGRRKP